MKPNIGQLMRQAQQLQANMQKAQEQLAALEVTGEAGGGMVKVVMNGRPEVRRVEIDPAVATSDREMLEDLVAAACNDATRRVGLSPSVWCRTSTPTNSTAVIPGSWRSSLKPTCR